MHANSSWRRDAFELLRSVYLPFSADTQVGYVFGVQPFSWYFSFHFFFWNVAVVAWGDATCMKSSLLFKVWRFFWSYTHLHTSRIYLCIFKYASHSNTQNIRLKGQFCPLSFDLSTSCYDYSSHFWYNRDMVGFFFILIKPIRYRSSKIFNGRKLKFLVFLLFGLVTLQLQVNMLQLSIFCKMRASQ